jgi:hypothetical protein
VQKIARPEVLTVELFYISLLGCDNVSLRTLLELEDEGTKILQNITNYDT